MSILKWPKSWTGVERNNKKLVYNERGALLILFNRNKTYVINQLIYDKIKKIVAFEILIGICFIAYCKSLSPLNSTLLCLIVLFGLLLDSLLGYVKNYFVRNELKKLCQKQEKKIL